jgi:hypothetical protein
MPAKGKSKVSTRQRARIAAGRVGGQTSREIAAETGLSESTVRKQATHPRTVTLVQRLIQRDEKELDAAWAKALQTVKKDLNSKDPAVVRDARRDLLRFITAGDPPLARLELAPAPEGSIYTLEELLSTMRTHDLSDAGS